MNGLVPAIVANALPIPWPRKQVLGRRDLEISLPPSVGLLNGIIMIGPMCRSAVRDTSLQIREGAAEAVRSVLEIMAERDSRHNTIWYFFVLTTATCTSATRLPSKIARIEYDGVPSHAQFLVRPYLG